MQASPKHHQRWNRAALLSVIYGEYTRALQTHVSSTSALSGATPAPGTSLLLCFCADVPMAGMLGLPPLLFCPPELCLASQYCVSNFSLIFIHSRLHWGTGWKCNQEVLFLNRIWTGKLWKTLHIKIVCEKKMKNLGISLQCKVCIRKTCRIFMQQSWLYHIYILQSQVLTTCLPLSPMIQSCL